MESYPLSISKFSTVHNLNLSNYKTAFNCNFILLFTLNFSYSQIFDIKSFLDQCPANDPAFDTILNDFEIRLNDEIVTDLLSNFTFFPKKLNGCRMNE